MFEGYIDRLFRWRLYTESREPISCAITLIFAVLYIDGTILKWNSWNQQSMMIWIYDSRDSRSCWPIMTLYTGLYNIFRSTFFFFKSLNFPSIFCCAFGCCSLCYTKNAIRIVFFFSCLIWLPCCFFLALSQMAGLRWTCSPVSRMHRLEQSRTPRHDFLRIWTLWLLVFLIAQPEPCRRASSQSGR